MSATPTLSFLLSAQAYFLAVLTGLRKERGSPHRQCQSLTATIPLTGLDVSLAPPRPPPPRPHFPSGGDAAGLPAAGQRRKGPATCSSQAYGGLVDQRPTFAQKARSYFARSRLLSPDKRRRDGRRGGGRGGGGGNKAARGPSAAALASTMTTRAGLSPLIKGYTQLGKQHPRQAVALVECCTSVTQSKRRAGIIRAAAR